MFVDAGVFTGRFLATAASSGFDVAIYQCFYISQIMCNYVVEFTVFMALTVKNMIFWVITLCSLQSSAFWRNISPLHSGLKSKPVKKPAETGSELAQLATCFHWFLDCFTL